MLLLNKTLLRLARGSWRWIAAIILVRMVTLIGMTRFARIIAGFLGSMTDPDMTLDKAGSAIAAALLMSLVMLVSQLLQGELEFRCSSAARTMMRTKIFTKVMELDAGNVERIGPVSAITSSVDAVENMQVYFSTYLPSLIFSVVAPVYLYFNLLDTDSWIALILLLTVLVLLPLNNLFRGRIEKLRKVYWGSVEDMTAYYLDSIRGLTTLKLFERTADRRNTLGEKAEKLNRDINSFMRINFTSFLVTEGLIYASIIGCTGISCFRLVKGRMDIADALTVLLLSYSFFSSIRQLIGATHSALTAVAAAGKVEEIFNVDTTRPYDPDIPAEEDAFPGIELRNVSFRYKGRDRTLDGIDLKAEKGRMTALVGLSGCGKSTIASLISKFIDPDDGHLFLEGRDYISFRPEELRREIVMVPQSVSLFSGTIRDNLLIADPKASDSELMDALEQSSLADFVRGEPKGLDTDVGDSGARLSGGQKQKIGIARALLSKAEYIILDEATSSVDVDSEQEIWNCIQRLALTRTLIVISHRLTSVRGADSIYLIENGRVSEHGTHEELMANHASYYMLVSRQEAEVKA